MTETRRSRELVKAERVAATVLVSGPRSRGFRAYTCLGARCASRSRLWESPAYCRGWLDPSVRGGGNNVHTKRILSLSFYVCVCADSCRRWSEWITACSPTEQNRTERRERTLRRCRGRCVVLFADCLSRMLEDEWENERMYGSCLPNFWAMKFISTGFRDNMGTWLGDWKSVGDVANFKILSWYKISHHVLLYD